MRKAMLWPVWLCLSVPATLAQTPTPKTQLTGTLDNPDGTGFSGNLLLSIAQSAAISANNSCGGPVQVVPNEPLNIFVTNGTMVGYQAAGQPRSTGAPKVFGSDCTVPSNIPYDVVLKDLQGNVVLTTQWLITGATEDVGSLYSAVPVTPNTALTLVTGYGAPVGSCNTYTVYEQLDAPLGTNLWYCVNGVYAQQQGTASAVGVGSVTGLSPNNVAFGSPSGAINQDPQFTYNGSTHTLNAPNFSGIFLGNATSATTAANALNATNAVNAQNALNANTATSAMMANTLATAPQVCPASEFATGILSNGNAICANVPGQGGGSSGGPGGGSASLPNANAPNQALISAAAGSSVYLPTTLTPYFVGVDRAKTVASNYTLSSADRSIFASAVMGAITVTLPPSPSVNQRVSIKKTDSSTNSVLIQAPSGSIDGNTSASLDVYSAFVNLQFDGSNWEILGLGSDASNGGSSSGGSTPTASPHLVSVNTNYTASTVDHTILVNASSGVVTVDTPPTPGNFQTLVVKKTDSSTNSVLISLAAGTVDATYSQLSLDAQGSYATIQTDGTNWWLLGQSLVGTP